MNAEDSRLLEAALGARGARRALELICGYFGCGETEPGAVVLLERGMSNRSFAFTLAGERYVCRCPGENLGNPMSRADEKRSLELAHRLGFERSYLYADGTEGWLLSRWIADFREPDYKSSADTERVVEVLRRLHALPQRPDYGLRPWEDARALAMELRRTWPELLRPWEALEARIGRLYERTCGDGVEKCFCHGDVYQSNWMLLPDGGVNLIDWEYAGTADPGVDLGYYIVDAGYGFDEAERLIRAYLGERFDEPRRFHFMAYVAIVAWYWFLWALLRETRGIDSGGALERWRDMARRYADFQQTE